MKLASRIRRLAARKVRVRITRRCRAREFIVRGPDGQCHRAATKTGALVNLLARLRGWPGAEWTITPENRRAR